MGRISHILCLCLLTGCAALTTSPPLHRHTLTISSSDRTALVAGEARLHFNTPVTVISIHKAEGYEDFLVAYHNPYPRYWIHFAFAGAVTTVEGAGPIMAIIIEATKIPTIKMTQVEQNGIACTDCFIVKIQ